MKCEDCVFWATSIFDEPCRICDDYDRFIGKVEISYGQKRKGELE